MSGQMQGYGYYYLVNLGFNGWFVVDSRTGRAYGNASLGDLDREQAERLASMLHADERRRSA
jgi:hypothetical protein